MSYNEALGATLIERAIREKIVLVGVTIPPDARTTPRPRSTSWPCWSTPPVPTSWPPSSSGASGPTRPTSSARARPRSCASCASPLDADTVVFDNELSPAQQYNLEKLLGRTALDRTAVILDIFAQNAHTPRGPGAGRAGPAALPPAPVAPRHAGPPVAAGRRHRHPRSGRDQARDRPASPDPADRQARAGATGLQRNRQLQRRSRTRSGLANVTHRRLHERREVDAAEPPHLGGRAGRGPAVRHARPDDAAAGPARWRARAAHRHGRLRPSPAPRAGRGVQEHARGRGRGGPARPPRRRAARPIPTRRSTPSTPCWPRSAPTECRS